MESVFRAKRNNKITNHLSRYPLEDTTDNKNQVSLVVFTLFDSRLQVAQRFDRFCRQVTRKINSNDNSNQHKQYCRYYTGMKMKFLFLFKRNIDSKNLKLQYRFL